MKEGVCEATSALCLRRLVSSQKAEEDEMKEAGCTFLEVWGVQTMSTQMHCLLFKISP